MKHKFVITGATGKLGSALIEKIGGGNCVGIARHSGMNLYKIDLSRWESGNDEAFSNFDTVIHLAAKAHIDNCEADRMLGKDGGTWKDNVEATKNVVAFCRRTKKKLIYLSTECVFDGKKEKYAEIDKTNPTNWYGVTKLESEKLISSFPGSLILRTVMAYDGRTEHKDIVQNFVSKLRRGEKISAATDQIVSFTYTGDIVDAILVSSEKELKGLYHFAGRDALSIYELAVDIAKLIEADSGLIIPRTMEEILGKERAAVRLKNSVFDSSKFIRDTGFRPTGIIEGLKKSLKPED